MPQKQRTLIYDVLNLSAGNLAVTAVHLNQWGNELIFDLIYRYPPEEKTFRLIFKDCRGIEWTVAQPDNRQDEQAQLLTHDLGEPQHRRTARIATVKFEAIISYGELTVEID